MNVYDQIEECLAALYTPQQVEAWWVTPMRWLGDVTPHRYLEGPGGPEFILKCLKELSQ